MLTLLLTILTAQADNLYKKYEWESRPVIEICPESNISLQEVEDAMEYWEAEVGFKYSTIKKVSHCSLSKETTIQITDGRNVDVSKNELANTAVHTYYYEGAKSVKYVDFAIVRIPTSTQDYHKDDLIKHELGHAIGYGHSNHNVMQPVLH
jgi:hypothetical protein